MGLPNGDRAIVPRSKLIGYLLSESHPVGRSKALFFRSMGFDETNVDLLESCLILSAQAGEVESVARSAYGAKYVLRGAILTPVGRIVSVRTVWIVEEGDDRPRLITAYPL